MTEKLRIAGIHHVTAICGSVVRNVGFYRTVLGLRLVKKTVNFDDPGTYHLYFGDRLGRPGTIMTFFPWETAPRGSVGVGTGAVVTFDVPAESLSWWLDRLSSMSISFDPPRRRFDAMAVAFRDPDGLLLEIEASPTPRFEPDVWGGGDVASEHATRGFRGATIPVPDPESTSRFMTETLGFEVLGMDGRRVRLSGSSESPGQFVDVVPVERRVEGGMGRGVVHHVAFRARDEEEQLTWRAVLSDTGLGVTDVLDRNYFRSIYFRHGSWTGGILFEIATDSPGFCADEPVDDLGNTLKLPEWLEPRRSSIEAILPPLQPA